MISRATTFAAKPVGDAVGELQTEVCATALGPGSRHASPRRFIKRRLDLAQQERQIEWLIENFGATRRQRVVLHVVSGVGADGKDRRA